MNYPSFLIFVLCKMVQSLPLTVHLDLETTKDVFQAVKLKSKLYYGKLDKRQPLEVNLILYDEVPS